MFALFSVLYLILTVSQTDHHLLPQKEKRNLSQGMYSGLHILYSMKLNEIHTH